MPPTMHSGLGGSYGRSAHNAARIRFRRAITLIVMTLVVPGSAQLMCGNRRVGRLAVRIWIGCWAVAAVIVCVALVSRRSLFALITNPQLLTIGRLLLIAGAVIWVGLLLDALRLGAPRSLRRGHRLTVSLLNGVVCLGLALIMLFASHLVSVQQNFLGSVFVSNTVSDPSKGRYNVLLLGADSGSGRSGWRPDSLTVASIDKDTGRTVLIGIPRNLQNSPFPNGSIMDQNWPNGFNCDDCEINAINTWVEDHQDKFGKTKDAGAKATTQAVEQTTGLKINYRISINMKGMRDLIDAVGGVTMDIENPIAKFGSDDAWKDEYIQPGRQKLNGEEALWYARSRVQSDDWSRMGRQKCLMHSMLDQLSPKTVLLRAQQIAESSSSLLATTIPRQDLDVFMDLALKAKNEKVSVASLVPPKVDTGNPDFDSIHKMIDEAIARSEGKTINRGGITKAQLPLLEAPTAEDLAKDPRKAGNTDDLNSSC